MLFKSLPLNKVFRLMAWDHQYVPWVFSSNLIFLSKSFKARTSNLYESKKKNSSFTTKFVGLLVACLPQQSVFMDLIPGWVILLLWWSLFLFQAHSRREWQLVDSRSQNYVFERDDRPTYWMTCLCELAQCVGLNSLIKFPHAEMHKILAIGCSRSTNQSVIFSVIELVAHCPYLCESLNSLCFS